MFLMGHHPTAGRPQAPLTSYQTFLSRLINPKRPWGGGIGHDTAYHFSQDHVYAHFSLDIGDTTLGNELVWRKGVANSDSYFTITNLLSSKILTAVSFNITIDSESENPNIMGLEIHGKILYSFFY